MPFTCTASLNGYSSKLTNWPIRIVQCVARNGERSMTMGREGKMKRERSSTLQPIKTHPCSAVNIKVLSSMHDLAKCVDCGRPSGGASGDAAVLDAGLPDFKL